MGYRRKNYRRRTDTRFSGKRVYQGQSRTWGLVRVIIALPTLNSNLQRNQSLLLFFAASIICSWAIWLWPVDQRRIIHLNFYVLGLDVKASFVMLLAGNCIPGVLAVMWASIGGRKELQQLRSTLTNWRAPTKWYLLAVTLPCAILFVALWLALFFVQTEYHWPPAIGILNTFISTLPFGTLWEEIAWRGYAFRNLRSRYSDVTAALLLGFYWSFWHIPLWLLTLHLNQNNRLPVLTMAFINLVAWSVIFAFAYERSSQSLPVTMLLHGTYGAISNYVAMVAPATNLFVIFAVMVLSIFFASVFAIKMWAARTQVAAASFNLPD